MIRRIINAYLIEVMKAIRQRSTYVGPLLVVAIVAAAPLARPLARDGASDYDFIAYAAPLSLNLLGFAVLLIFSSSLIASEMGTGTIRMILVRPIRRREFVAAKFFAGVTYAALLSLCAAGSAWSIAYAFGDLTGVRFGGEVVYTDREMRTTFLIALGLNFLPQIAAVAYGLMISTCTRNTGSAIAAAIGLWILMDTLKHPVNGAKYVFTSYLEGSWQVFAGRALAIDSSWSPDAQFAVATSAGATVVFLSLATLIMSRRNLYA